MDITAVNQKISSYYTATAGDYFSLLKPRVMSLVIFTALIGLIVAPGEIHPVIGFTAILCIAIAAGASGCLNMWYEADIDAKMERTAGRPIPSGRIDAQSALHFGVALAVSSVLVMGLTVNVVAALLLTVTILLYVVVYTMWLKRRTAQNIVIGGASGAFPPMVAWAAVTGDVSLESFVLFAIIFMWTPPHFWALALYRREEYAKVGIPMLPVTHGEKFTLLHIILYTIILAIVTLMPFSVGMSGLIYLFFATILNAIFLYYVVVLYRNYSDKLSKKVFNYSILYLSLIFAAFLVDHYYKFIFV